MAKEQVEINENTSLFKLGWPIFVQVLLTMCIGYIDTFMLSHYSQTAVGGISNANQIIGLLTLAFSIISSATGVIVAQYLGAKLKDELNRIYTVSIAFNLVLSVVISFILLVFTRQLFSLMQVPKDLLPDAVSYMRIVGGVVFVEAVFDTFSQIFRNNGMTKVGMVISLGMNILNIGGNYLFLFGPLSYLDLGVSGVAISSAFSKCMALAAAIIFFIRNVDGSISIKYLIPFPKEILKKLLKLGIPTAGENISYNIAQVVILMMVNTMGLTAINAKAYCSILSNFAYLYSVSAAMATAIVTGHAVGAKKYDAAYKRVLKTLGGAMISAEAIAIVSYFISGFTLRLFTDDAAIVALGRKVLLVCIFLEMGRTANLVIINSMRAAGDVKFPTYLGMASLWGVSVVIGYILGIGFGLGLVGIWIAMALDEILRGVVVLIRWIHGGWRGKRVVSE